MSKELTPDEIVASAERTLAEVQEAQELAESRSKLRASSSSYEALLAYYESVVRQEYFQAAIKRLREELSIPPEGLVPDTQVGFNRHPQEWDAPEYSDKWKALFAAEREICAKYGLSYTDWGMTIDAYFFYNQIRLFDPASSNLCIVSDLAGEHEGSLRVLAERKKEEDSFYPIAIRISPYASLRNILDFLKEAYSLDIEPLQKKYRGDLKIGRVRLKDKGTQARNDLIYANQHLPYKRMNDLLVDNGYKVLDPSHLTRIISLERKRRKEV